MATIMEKQHWGQDELRTGTNWGKGLLRSIGKKIERYIQLSQQRRALLEMDAHQLNDIGINRVEAVELARSSRFLS